MSCFLQKMKMTNKNKKFRLDQLLLKKNSFHRANLQKDLFQLVKSGQVIKLLISLDVFVISNVKFESLKIFTLMQVVAGLNLNMLLVHLIFYLRIRLQQILELQQVDLLIVSFSTVQLKYLQQILNYNHLIFLQVEPQG